MVLTGASRAIRILFSLFVLALVVPTALAQQTGSISGRVTADGQGLPGVTVEASSNVLPQPRVTVTDGNGDYRFPTLPPGSYNVTYSLSGMQTVTRKAAVQLGQNTAVDISMGVQGVTESITVTAEASLVDRTTTEIESGISEDEILALPVTQDYSDLQKLIPGVMYTQDSVRGPSAGSSGQDNVYQFDGANVTMPLFGVLNVEPNTRDVAQVTVTKGGANATEFNRAGGFLIDTVSKSGTNDFFGELGYQVLNASFVSDQAGATNLTYDQDRSWANVNIGGPVLRDRVFFYGSYYRPEYTRSQQANLYGELPEYNRERDEYFGKLTYTPTQSLLFNATYRDSSDRETSGQFTSMQASTTGTGFKTELNLGTVDASWVISPRSFATAKFVNFENPGGGAADFLSDAQVSTAPGTQLNIGALAEQGRLILPTPIGNNAAQSAFVAPFINQYGYICPDNPSSVGLTCTAGQRTGGGTVGYGQFAADDDSFYRKTLQLRFNYMLGSNVTHDLHVGYQNSLDEEDRFQTSNGWGVITIPAGVAPAGTCPASACGTATPAFFVAAFPQQTGGNAPVIHSEITSQMFQINDAIRWNNWTFNAGLLVANDTLYGQGLEEFDNYAGFKAKPGSKYKMHEFGWDEMIQPRVGATWAYNGNDTVWTSYAKYYPPANSDARAASWDRNLVAQINAYFDAQGRLIGVAPNASSSGKWWQEGVKPPSIDEYLIGTARQMTSRWSGRLYGRYREGQDYLEDTNNDARVNPTFGAPADIREKGLYVPDLSLITGAIGSGSSYVIANLDGAFTRYLEATLENEYRADKFVVNGSYTWSHFYGNFDQDNTSFNSANDAAIFIGSSNLGDSQGRQLWNFKYGDLRGDRRHVVKARGTYMMPWNATAGLFAFWQSGQPYQLESVLPYRGVTTSTSDTNRYAEPAGRRRTPSTYNADFNYTQNFGLPRGLNLQLALDVFNITDNQAGYNYETRIGILGFTNDKSKDQLAVPDSISDAVLKAQVAPNDPNFNRADWGVNAPTAKTFYAPRRFQIAARLQF